MYFILIEVKLQFKNKKKLFFFSFLFFNPNKFNLIILDFFSCMCVYLKNKTTKTLQKTENYPRGLASFL